MTFAALLEELRAGRYLSSGGLTGANGNGHDISYRTRDSNVLITYKGGVFFYDIVLQYPPKHSKYGTYTTPISPRKLHQRQIYEAMKQGAKHHAHL